MGKLGRLMKFSGKLQQNGGMSVVAAGVHIAGVPGCPGQIGLLCQRQRIQIGTKCQRVVATKIKKSTDCTLCGRKEAAFQKRKPSPNPGQCFGQPIVRLRNFVKAAVILNDLQNITSLPIYAAIFVLCFA